MSDLALWVDVDALDCDCKGTDAQILLAAQAARERLFRATGYQFGEVTETVRPYRQNRDCGCGGRIPDAVSSGWGWSSWSGYRSFVSCGCGGPSYILLAPDTSEIDEVKVDGVVLVEDTDWYLYEGTYLMKVDGTWRCCQSLTDPTTELNTFSVTYTHGPGVPAGGQMAAQVLACEYLKALTGDKNCTLAGRITTVTRDGVSSAILNPADVQAFALTGISVVDDWIMSIPRWSGSISMPGLSGLLRKTTATPP